MIYLSARDLDNAAGKRKVSLLLHFLGHDGVKLYNTFVFRPAVAADDANNIIAVPEEDKNVLNTVLGKFDEHYGRGKMRNLKRQAFLVRTKRDDESAMDFIADLRHKVQACEYGDAEESILCDKIVDGMKDEKTRAELLNLEENLNLENCIRVCRRDELTAIQLGATGGATGGITSDAHYVTSGCGRQRHRGSGGRPRERSDKEFCEYCTHQHPPRQCPAYSKYCGSCGTKGHFAKSIKCQRKDKDAGDRQDRQRRRTRGGRSRGGRSRGGRSRGGRGRGGYGHDRSSNVHHVNNGNCMNSNVHYVNNDSEYEQFYDQFDECQLSDVFSCDSNNVMSCNDNSKESWYVNLSVSQGKSIDLKIDTGAVVNVLNGKTVDKMGLRDQVKPSNLILCGINSSKQSDGVISLMCSYKSKQILVEFQVLNHEKGTNLLSKADSLKFGLIARVDQVVNDPNQLLLKYNDVFDNTIGCIPGTYHIKLDDSVQSVVIPARSVPAPIREQVKKELDHLENTGIIAKVQGPTDWVSPMVCVRKPSGRIRLCIDPFHLNRAILREHYPMSSIDDILTRLNGSKYFSVLDANMGFYQIRLSEESSRLTTFSTPFGRYRHLRLPMGISSAPEIYQCAMADIFNDIDGVEIVMDDILIHGTSRAEHDSRLEAVLKRSHEVNLKMNPKKTQIAQSEVKYVGHKLTCDGLKPDEDRIKSIVNMKDPENISELETILGMISYVSKFIPKLSDLNAPLRELKTRDEWTWGEGEHAAFQRVKDALVSTRVLRYYNVRKPVTVTVDASRKGLGAAVLQDGGVVAYASRALTPTEQRYAQIELEMLAIVFGCQRFHKMIYGKRDVVVESDHKPLENLHMKPIHSAPMRIQRMMLKLQPYTYTVKYVKGAQLGLADCLSRLPQPADPKIQAESEESFMVCSVETLSDSNHQRIATATAKDSELQAVRQLIIDGWPDQRQELPPSTVQYWDFREEMGIYNGVVFRGSRICIPNQLRRETLNILHSSHMGMVYTKQRAREVVFWPGMNAHIEEIIRRCPTCLEHRNRAPREPLKSHPVPELPWDHVSSDLFQLDGKNYLVMVDAYSGYIEVEALHDTSSVTVIKTVKANIARYGIMSKLTTDNGPQFTSREFKQFVLKYNIQHVTSSPEYPQSNGLAERAVQTVKRLIKKAQQDGQDVYLALLELRNTPRDQVLGSPVQKLMGRRTKTLLPTAKSMLKPTSVPPDKVHEKLQQYRDVQKHYYDRGKKPQPEIIPGDAVRLRTPTGWKPAEYMQAHDQPRSHVVKAGDQARPYRRNRNRLMITAEKPHVIIPIKPNPTPVSEPPGRIPHNPQVAPPPRPPDVVKPHATTSPQQPVTKSGRRVQRPAYLKDFVD